MASDGLVWWLAKTRQRKNTIDDRLPLYVARQGGRLLLFVVIARSLYRPFVPHGLYSTLHITCPYRGVRTLETEASLTRMAVVHILRKPQLFVVPA